MYHLYFYVPKTHLEQVKKAVFAALAGKIGNYSCCAWQTEGKGQYCPLPGSNPYQGVIGQVEYVDEMKVETVCLEEVLDDVIQALKKAHPYEMPAYGVIKLYNDNL
jgi:structural toxin protein (hemagglutinin/hemolysin) RtxA